jgi:hypothetical protein
MYIKPKIIKMLGLTYMILEPYINGAKGIGKMWTNNNRSYLLFTSNC